MSKADDVQVNVNSGYSGERALRRQPDVDAGGVIDGSPSSIQSTFGKKHARRHDERFSDEALQRAVAAVGGAREARARRSGSDAGAARRRQYQAGERVLRLDGEPHAGGSRARGAHRARAGAQGRRPQGSRLHRRRTRRQRARQQQGLFAYHRSHERELHAHRAHGRRHRIGLGRRRASTTGSSSTSPASAQRAIEKARLSRNPVAIEPGRYTVILEPQAVGDLVQLMAVHARRARRPTRDAARSRSRAAATRSARRSSIERVTHLLRSAGSAAARRSRSTARASRSARQVWIENGVLKQLFYSRFWAQKQGKRANRRPGVDQAWWAARRRWTT